ncbi:MAG TPA: PKD domain-containing protein [Methanocorpusculum sp.]|nr:PKD domain-containing protein [Methanocorpusculum sp.]HJK39077.1 PKD domain-containing protein [Methanocorpusculum sp.]
MRKKIVVILLICALVLGCIGVVSAEGTNNSSNTSTGDGNKNNPEGSISGGTDNKTNTDPPANNEANTDPPANNEANTDPPANNETNTDPPANNETNTDPPANNETNTTTTTTPIPKKDLEASISANVTKGSAPLTVNFTAEVDDSLVAKYKWEVHEDEGYMDGRSVEYTYKEAGKYTVTLTLTPKDTTTYSTTEITKTITVTQEKLEAIISASEEEGVAPLKITFTGTAKGNPVSWEWDFDDGSSLIKNQTKVEHSFTKAGVYNVRLTIRNETGSTASTTKQIEVTEKPKTTTTTATPTKTTAPTTATTTVSAVKSASLSADDNPIPNPLDIIEELIRLLKVMLVPENYSLA